MRFFLKNWEMYQYTTLIAHLQIDNAQSDQIATKKILDSHNWFKIHT